MELHLLGPSHDVMGPKNDFYPLHLYCEKDVCKSEDTIFEHHNPYDSLSRFESFSPITSQKYGKKTKKKRMIKSN